MESIAKLMMGIGGTVALLGGVAILVFGDRMRERDAQAGRVNAAYPARESQRRTAFIIAAIGAIALILLFVF